MAERQESQLSKRIQRIQNIDLHLESMLQNRFVMSGPVRFSLRRSSVFNAPCPQHLGK